MAIPKTSGGRGRRAKNATVENASETENAFSEGALLPRSPDDADAKSTSPGSAREPATPADRVKTAQRVVDEVLAGGGEDADLQVRAALKVIDMDNRHEKPDPNKRAFGSVVIVDKMTEDVWDAMRARMAKS